MYLSRSATISFPAICGANYFTFFLYKEQRMNLVNLKFGEVVTLHKGRWNGQ